MPALGNFAKGRRILTIHFHHGGVKSAWEWRLIYRLACAKFTAITFPADFIRQEAEQLYPPVAKLAHTIRYPLPTPELPTAEQKLAARRALGLPLDVPIIGNAGWLIPRKRFDVFLRTAASISRKFPAAHFVIAGDGGERARLKALAKELKLDGKVTWTGWVSQMEHFHRSLDVLLFNSDWDAMGLTPLEAAVLGVPVVASVVNGGLKEVLSSSEWGVLFNRHEPEALAEAVVHLLENPAAARKLGLAGRMHVSDVSNPEKIAIAHEKLLAVEKS
jgi:glycosyltransferase involved in cell wall biosynthesis